VTEQEINQAINQYNNLINNIEKNISQLDRRKNRRLKNWLVSLEAFSSKLSKYQNRLNTAINKEKSGVDSTIDKKIESVRNRYESNIQRFLDRCNKIQEKFDNSYSTRRLNKKLETSQEYKAELEALMGNPDLSESAKRRYEIQIQAVDQTIARLNDTLAVGQNNVDIKRAGCLGQSSNMNSPVYKRDQGAAYWESVRQQSYQRIDQKYQDSSIVRYMRIYQYAVNYLNAVVASISAPFDAAIAAEENVAGTYREEISRLRSML